MKVSNVIPITIRPKPKTRKAAKAVPVIGYVGEGGRVVFTAPRTSR